MPKDALERFRQEFHQWVSGYEEKHPHEVDADNLYRRLAARIPEDRLRQIGAAFSNGWLETEPEPGRGYFVREADRDERRGGQFTLIHNGKGDVGPCWELFVQLADYGWLKTVAERYGQAVRLEDHLMDITVYRNGSLLLYVENKTERAAAERLLRKMEEYGEQGFESDAPDQNNDPLRKAKYMTRSRVGRPKYFGLSALGYRTLFQADYFEGNRFQLVEVGQDLSAPLVQQPGSDPNPPPRSPVDPLAVELERPGSNIWASLGSGQTAYNFYAPGKHGDAVVLGVYEDGSLWTDVETLGSQRAYALREALGYVGVDLPIDGAWAFWRGSDDGRAKIHQLDPVAVGAALRSVCGA